LTCHSQLPTQALIQAVQCSPTSGAAWFTWARSGANMRAPGKARLHRGMATNGARPPGNSGATILCASNAGRLDNSLPPRSLITSFLTRVIRSCSGTAATGRRYAQGAIRERPLPKMGDGANDENPILKTILEMVSSQHRISNQLQTIIERTDTMSEALDKIKAYAAQIDAATAYGQKNQPSRKSLCLQLLR
jgi:hypothetical protein